MVRIIIEIDSGVATVGAGDGQQLMSAAAMPGGVPTATAAPAASGAATNAGRAPAGPSGPGAMAGGEGPLPFTEMATTPAGTGEESAGAAPEGLFGAVA